MIVSLALITAISAVKCPEGWSTYPEGTCYKEFTEKLSWNGAESKCQQFGGDLVSVASQTEQEYILSLINRNHYDYYWIGLNDVTTTGKYEWISTDGTTNDYKFKWWAKGMPTDNNGARCTFMLFSDHLPGDEDNGQLGKWTKGVCGNQYKFVCKALAINVPNKCGGDDYSYWKEADKCYRLQNVVNEWHEGYDKCNDKFGGTYANVRSEAEMNAINNLIDMKNTGKGVWIGLSDFFTPGTLTWSLNQDQPSYTNWVYGEPNDDFMDANTGATCTYIPSQSTKWATMRCGDRKNGFMCERTPDKVCPRGWTYFKSDKNTDTCVQFVVNGRDHAQWWTARQYCDSIGSSLFVPSSESENQALAKYYDDWRRAGVTRLWLGAVSTENCQFERVNGYPLQYEGWEADEPNCQEWNENQPQCAYLSINEVANNWKVGDCYQRDAFACQVDVGQQIHEIAKPTSDYYCKQDPKYKEVQFKLYEEDGFTPMCYQFLKTSGDIKNVEGTWDETRAICQGQGGDLASVHSAKQNAWMFSHIGGMGYWLGANKVKGKMPKSWADGSQFDFVSFYENEPRDKFADGGDCLKYRTNEDNGAGYWLARSCVENKWKPICQKPATKGTHTH